MFPNVYDDLLALEAQRVIDKSLRDHEEAVLRMHIDQALDRRDKEAFTELTNILKLFSEL